MSHPSWVRGLKLPDSNISVSAKQVAPLVGAWIETVSYSYVWHKEYRRTPSWVRGLKPLHVQYQQYWRAVAPLVGAWIETLAVQDWTKVNASHPSWVRGLKLIRQSLTAGLFMSHPSWVRGLKQKKNQK